MILDTLEPYVWGWPRYWAWHTFKTMAAFNRQRYLQMESLRMSTVQRVLTSPRLGDRRENLTSHEAETLTYSGAIYYADYSSEESCHVYRIDNGADWEIVDQHLQRLRECSNSLTGGQQF